MNIRKHFLVYKGLPKDIYLLFISNVINKTGSFIMPLLTLILTEKIGFTKPEAGSFSTIAMASQAPFLILGGKLADKFGSKKIIVIFSFTGAMIYLVCGFLKPSVTVAILIIIASNLYAAASPAYNSIVAKITPSPLIKNAYSLMYLGFNVGLTIGPAIGGVLFNSYLNLLFIIDAFTTILSSALILIYIKENKNSNKPLPQAENKLSDATDTNSVFTFLYRNPILVIFSATLLIYNFCYIQWTFILPLQSVDIFNENGASFYSFLVSINAIAVIFATPLLTSFTQKTPPLKSIYIGGIFYFVSFALFSANKYMATFIISIMVMTIGEILISINTNDYIAQRTPKMFIGRANSLLSIVNGTGYAIGPVIMGNVIMSITFPKSWLMISALMLCGAAAMYFVRRLDKSDAAESTGDVFTIPDETKVSRVEAITCSTDSEQPKKESFAGEHSSVYKLENLSE